MLNLAFTMPRDSSETWLRLGGLENVRILREGPSPVAMLVRIPMGQFFGGRSVPMLGIAAVAVAPEARGRGLARQLMQDSLTEMHADGWPISVLYPSTQTLYRQVGYEQAGHRFITRVPLGQIDVRDRGGPLIPLDESHQPAVLGCYQTFAAALDGWLDRGAFGWLGVRERRAERYSGFGIGSQEHLDGYVFLTQRVRPETGRHDVVLSDVAFRTAAAGRRLLGLLADFATIGDDLVFAGGPHHPLLWLLGQQRHTTTFKNYWMLRMVDARRALSSRGYPAGLRAEVSLEIADDLIGANHGRHLLTIEDGRGHVETGGAGTVRIGVRALAALWSGFVTPAQLRIVGAIEGPDDALAALGSAFAGGTPAMTDMF